MNTQNILNAWQVSETDADSINKAVGPVVIDESLLRHVSGGAKSAGWYCSVSGECNETGQSCWPFPW